MDSALTPISHSIILGRLSQRGPFQQPAVGKTKALTAYSTTRSSQSIVPFDEMEVSDSDRLPGGDDDKEESQDGGKSKVACSGSLSMVTFDEMEVLDISLPGGGVAEAEEQMKKGPRDGAEVDGSTQLLLLCPWIVTNVFRNTSYNIPVAVRTNQNNPRSPS